MASIDLKKTYRDHYTAKKDPQLVDVPPRPHLMIDGQGDPGVAQEYFDAVSSLYPIAYGIRRVLKEELGDAYTVMPLEGLWWADDMSAYVAGDRSAWKWTLMICQPNVVDEALAQAQIEAITDKKRLPSGHRVRFQMFGDGRAAQILHLGPYSEEGPTIRRLHDFIAEKGMSLTGKHHEIYLSDPRKVAPERVKTILRQPATDS